MGYLLRGELVGGSKIINGRGIIQYVSTDYIDPSGEMPTNNLIYGLGLGGNILLDKLKIQLKVSYCHWNEQLKIIPSMYIPNKDQIDLVGDISFYFLDFKIDQAYKFLNDENGVLSTQYDADIDMKFDFKFLSFDADGGISYDRYSFEDEFFFDWGLGVFLKIGLLKGGFSFNKKEDESKELKITTSFKKDNFEIFGKIKIVDFDSINLEL